MAKVASKKYINLIIKIVSWTLAAFVVLCILLIVLIQIPAIQNYAKDQTVSWLNGKLRTKVSIEKLRINFPNQILIEKIYFEDQHKDSLLWGNKITVNISLFKLLQNKVEVKSVELDDISVKVKRVNPDTVFNFNYILQAFSSNKVKDNSASSTPLEFNFGKLDLKNISLHYIDDAVGVNTQVFFSTLKTSIKDFDLDKSIYGIADLNVDGLNVSLNRYHPLVKLYNEKIVTPYSNVNTPLPEIRLGKIDFTNAQFKYNDAIEGLHSEVNAKQLLLQMGILDLDKLIIPINHLSLIKTNLTFSIDKLKNDNSLKVSVDSKKPDNFSWQITAKQILVDSSNVKFDNNNQAPTKNRMDYQHLLLTAINMQMDSLNLSPLAYQGVLNELSVNEKSGIHLKEFSTRFFFSDHQTKLEQLNLKTDKTILREKLILNYNTVGSISTHPENIQIEAKLNNCKLAISDVLLLAPMLDKNLKGYESSVLNINSEINGYVKNLKIPKLELSGLGSTSIKANGLVEGLPKIDQLYADINIAQFQTVRKDIEQILPAKTIPDFFRIPDKVKMIGKFKGSLMDFNTKILAQTSDGNALIDAKMGTGETFETTIKLDSVNIGKIIKQDRNIGKVTLLVGAKGAGYNYKTMIAEVNGEIIDANIKDYEYKNLLLALNLNKGNASIVSSLADPNINYHLVASAELENPFPSFKMDLQLDTINLMYLNLVKKKIAFSGQINADFEHSNPDSLEGNLLIRKVNFTYLKNTISTDSIILIAKNEIDQHLLELNSRPVKMLLKGKYKLTELGTAIEHTINQYYEIPGFKDTAFYPQDWEANFKFKTSPIVLRFMPALEGTDSITALVKYNSTKNDLRLNASAPLVQYDNYHVKSLNFSANTGQKQLDYHLRLRQAGTQNFIINETTLDGQVKANTVYGNLIFRDKKLQENYHIAGSFNHSAKGIQIHFDPDSLLLNKQQWLIKKDNSIRYDSTGVYAKDFQFQYKDQSIALNSIGNENGAPIKLEFIHFDINTITDIAKKDSLFADGIINGSVIISNATSHPTFTSDVKITNLAYQRNIFGDLLMKVDNIGENRFNANVELKGVKNHASLMGTYQTKEGSMDLHFVVDSLDMAIFKPFSADQLKEASGNVRAKVDLNGSFEKPSVKGVMNFEHVFLTSKMLGQKFKIDQDEVTVDDRGIHFNEFILEDSLGNKAVLDGDLLTKNFREYDFDLKLNADDFNLVNSTQGDNQLFFGKLNMDADIKITGNLEAPIVNAKFLANKYTNLTVVMPGSNPEIQSREGVVNFIDTKKINDTITRIIINDSLVSHSAFSGLILNTIIETDTAAVFTMVIDSQSGDAITVQGKTTLAASLDESKKINLTGMYELERGSYQFSLNMLKKKFEIVKGSTITWTGDPMSAIVNIKALYKLKSSPIDLVEQQLVGQTPTEINKYKQRVPVEVYLKKTGDLMKPEIKFDVVIPEQDISKWPLVDEKLQKIRTDESEMNKQVFALLILGRFVGEDITQNNTGSTTKGTMMRQSVSGVLSSQLNRVAGDLVKGVDLNFDFESQDDYSSGTAQTRTDLKVGMSRTMKNDRIKVNVGANVPIEGAPTAQNASFITSDVQVDYMLSKDGKYMLRTYSKNKYEGVIEGQIIETGITFIFTVEYDKFREMFRRSDASKDEKNKKQKK